MFVVGLALYAVSSLVGGLATGPGLLVAARAVQGLGGALLFPATLSLVNTTFAEGRERNRALSVWAGAGASGLILGSLLGGVLTQAFGWAAVFSVNVPLAVLAIVLALPLIAPDAERGAGRRFDLPGALTATLGATLVVFTVVQGPESGWTSPLIVTSAIAGVALLAIFLVIESRSGDPLMPLRLFGNRNLGAGMAVSSAFMATFGTLLYFETLYFQNVHGYSAMESGLAFVVPMVAILAGSRVGGRMATRFGVRATLLTSLALGAVGAVVLALSMSPDGSYAELIPGLLVLGLGQGITFVTMFAAASAGVATPEQGVASGMASTGQQVGSAVGLAVLVAIANEGNCDLAGEALRAATIDGLRTVVFVVAAGIAATVLVALNFKRATKNRAAQRRKLHRRPPPVRTAAPTPAR